MLNKILQFKMIEEALYQNLKKYCRHEDVQRGAEDGRADAGPPGGKGSDAPLWGGTGVFGQEEARTEVCFFFVF